MDYKKIHDLIIDNARNRIYNSNIHQNHHIIPIHENKYSVETVPLTIKEHYIVHKLRYKFANSYGNLVAYNMLKGINIDIHRECSRMGGKKGGVTCYINKTGIFSPDYDRSAASKALWKSGAFDHIPPEVYVERGKLGGAISRDTGVGIHGGTPEERSKWGKYGAECLNESGNRSGIYSSKWRENNLDIVKTICSKGGKIGSQVIKNWLFYTNGVDTIRAENCPDGWWRGNSSIQQSSINNLSGQSWTNLLINRKTNIIPDNEYIWFYGAIHRLKSGDIKIIIEKKEDKLYELGMYGLKLGHNILSRCKYEQLKQQVEQ